MFLNEGFKLDQLVQAGLKLPACYKVLERQYKIFATMPEVNGTEIHLAARDELEYAAVLVLTTIDCIDQAKLAERIYGQMQQDSELT